MRRGDWPLARVACGGLGPKGGELVVGGPLFWLSESEYFYLCGGYLMIRNELDLMIEEEAGDFKSYIFIEDRELGEMKP